MYPNCGSSYSDVVSSARYGRFLQLLIRWRFSIYKILYRDLLVLLSFYYALFLLYFYILDEDAQEIFEAIVVFCRKHNDLVPLTFVLGYYVRVVIQRWWDQYMHTPWPDPIAVFVSSLVYGNDSTGRIMRRTVMRYVCLCLCMVMIKISPPARKRFGTYDKLIEAGLLMPSERDIIEKLDAKFPDLSKHWMPIVWACSILVRGRNEGRIRDDFALRTLIDNINYFRSHCHMLLQYDFVSIPLVYTQVVTLAVYMYFFCALLGHQYIHKDPNPNSGFEPINFYFPVFLLMEFMFFIGWLKVAEVIICPFGEDDQDFEVNWLIERNLQISYIIVDEMYHKHPELLKDQYWDSLPPEALPYPKEEPPGHGKLLMAGIASLLHIPTHGRLDPQTSIESAIYERTPHKRRRNALNSDSSFASASSYMHVNVPKYLSLDDVSETAAEKYDLEDEVSLMTDTDTGGSSDLFEKLREERERARNERQPYRMIPVTIVENEHTDNPTNASDGSNFTIYVSFDDTTASKDRTSTTRRNATETTGTQATGTSHDEEELLKVSNLAKYREKKD